MLFKSEQNAENRTLFSAVRVPTVVKVQKKSLLPKSGIFRGSVSSTSYNCQVMTKLQYGRKVTKNPNSSYFF